MAKQDAKKPAFKPAVKKAWKAQVAAAKKEVKAPTVKELAKWIKEDKEFVLVDVRKQGEVNAGWIDDTNFKAIPRGKLDPDVAKQGKLKTTQTIVIYCKAGSRAALAASTLKSLGFNDVYFLMGGFKAWMKKVNSLRQNPVHSRQLSNPS